MRVKVRLFFQTNEMVEREKSESFLRFHGASCTVFVMRGLRSRMQLCVWFFVPSLSGSSCVRCRISTIDPCEASQSIVGKCSYLQNGCATYGFKSFGHALQPDISLMQSSSRILLVDAESTAAPTSGNIETIIKTGKRCSVAQGGSTRHLAKQT